MKVNVGLPRTRHRAKIKGDGYARNFWQVYLDLGSGKGEKRHDLAEIVRMERVDFSVQ